MKRLMAMLLVLMLCIGGALAENISPTTGLPLDGEPVTPMLAVISHTYGDTKVNGKKVSAAGVGKRQPWGGQQADVIYESILYQDGCSRFVYLYHDALVRGESISAGPLRSVRDVHIDLSKAWSAGLIYGAGTVNTTPGLADIWDCCFDTGMPHVRPHIQTDTKRKAPDHRSADVSALHELMADKTFAGTWFAFTDDAPAASLADGRELRITWGDEKQKQVWTTNLAYDEESRKYLCYSGKAPLKTFHDTTFTQESQLAFDNVIVQYAAHSFPTRMLPEVDLLSGGKAIILRGGKRVDAQWVCENGQTKFVDENGQEVPLSRGKTYIAFWDESCGKLEYQ